ncbi:MBL fold metallo-hydrolase [Psychrobacter sp. HD31]|uniref:MBL fold metallo-hydrolase n=1 Tax=Psychrobacter sp. HD31 TaxID=3112003 RepID=UPI003DA3B9A1
MQEKNKNNELQQILRIDGHIQDIYLAVYANKLLLLDGCCRPDVELVLATIRNILGREISQLKAVIVTHMHADHAGGAAYLKKHTGCKIISSNKPTQWYGGLNGRVEYLLDLSLSYFVAYRRGRKFKNLNYPAELKADILVNDGDAVPMFEDWQIIETPGHTDRDLSVYHAKTGKVYVADLMIKLENRRRGIRFVAPYNIDDPVAYKKSVAKIKQYHPYKVMMAHGGQTFVEQATFDDLIKMTPNKPRTNKDVYQDVVFRMMTTRKPKK